MGESILCTKIVLNVRNNFCTQHVLPRFEFGIFMYWTCNSMNNLSSYCGLVDAKIRASDKDLPVQFKIQKFQAYKSVNDWSRVENKIKGCVNTVLKCYGKWMIDKSQNASKDYEWKKWPRSNKTPFCLRRAQAWTQYCTMTHYHHSACVSSFATLDNIKIFISFQITSVPRSFKFRAVGKSKNPGVPVVIRWA